MIKLDSSSEKGEKDGMVNLNFRGIRESYSAEFAGDPAFRKCRRARPPLKFDIKPAQIETEWKVTLPDGFIGDPGKASKEKGEKLIKAWVDNFADLISRIKKVKVQPF